MAGGKLSQNNVLGQVGVLVLIHKYMTESACNGVQGKLAALQKDIQVQEDVVEIHHAGLLAHLAIEVIDAVNLRLFVVVVVFPVAAGALHVRRRGHKVVLCLGDSGKYLLRFIYFVVQLELLDAGFHSAHRILGIVDGEVGGELNNIGKLPEETDEHGMEGTHPKAAGLALPYHHGYPLFHLPCRFLGKSKRKDAFRRHPFFYQIGNSGSQNAGFS